MFKLIPTFLVLFLLNSTLVLSQDLVEQKPEKIIPIVVSTAFKNKFPDAEAVWYTKYQGRYDQQLVYEGRFVYKNRDAIAVYDTDGKPLAFVVKIDQRELPDEVLTYMSQNFPAFPIQDAALVTTQKNEITYEVGLLIDNRYVVKVFSEKGDFIKSTQG